MAADLSRQESVCHTTLFANYHTAMRKKMVLRCLNKKQLLLCNSHIESIEKAAVLLHISLQVSPVLLSL